MNHLSGNAKRGALLIATVAAAAIAASASASGADLDESYKDDGGYSSDGSAWKVGGFIGVKPTYEGSDEYEAFGLPYIFPVLSGGSGFFSRIDARGLDDVRFRLYEQDGFIAGPLAGYDLGRDEDDGDLLVGLGDIDGGFVGGGFAGYQLGAILFDVSYHHYFSDADGYQIRFGAETVRYVSDRTKVTARIGATYADDGYMDTYFGTAAFVADSGFKDVHAQLGVETDLDDRWSLRASARYSHLLGDAADSPVVASEDQFYGLLGLSYKFYMAE
jgi:outer membrane protein